ncbi:MAG: MBL fold metallo-hydrolase [Solobacterium sp.]|nr:MBL fold metallo-hydrolase [Solobacterium sp.]
MELIQWRERILLAPYEDERDRPILGYIEGDRYTLAVDAGHSSLHLQEFYEALQKADKPLPDYTVLTHWHWDHSFALPWIHGISIANTETDKCLREVQKNMSPDYARQLMAMEPSIALEYAPGQEMKVSTPDLVFAGQLTIDLGGISAQLFHGVSPHTEDSTYILIPEEGVLFLGDAPSGVYPDWHRDPLKARQMIELLESIPFEMAVGGHWQPQTKAELIRFIAEN